MSDSVNSNTIPINIGANTKFIISTSGRLSSLNRYRILLQDLLNVDIAYIPINSGKADNVVIDPQRFAWALRGLPALGGAISRDIKHSIIPFLDEVDELAMKIQSVNTVVVQGDGSLKGYNTDAIGFRAAIVNGIAKSGVKVTKAVCYGYGGVASVVTSILSELGIEVCITGRNPAAAERRAQELSVGLWSKGTAADLFVNCTPGTEHPLNLAPGLLDALSGCTIAFDHEMPGKYLADYCAENNIYHIKGLDMYYPQMYEQWKLFLEGIVEPSAIPELIKTAEERM